MTLSNIRLCSCCCLPTRDNGNRMEVYEWRRWSWNDLITCAYLEEGCDQCKIEAEELGITLEELHQRKEI